MAKITNLQIVEQCKKMCGMHGEKEKTSGKITYYKQRYGYILGGQGETYSKELAQQWGAVRRCGKSASYFIRDCARWFGREIVDCSGMIVEAIRAYNKSYSDRAANTFRNQFSRRGKISSIPEVPGVAVWKSGHIGIYIGGGKVIEARGYRHGVVLSELSSQAWKEWGYIDGITYVKDEEPPEKEDKPIFKRLLKYKSSMMRGEDVRTLQKLLAKAGQKPGAADGIFGKNTRNAVKSYQRAKRLTVDGIAGKNTITALGGEWRG